MALSARNKTHAKTVTWVLVSGVVIAVGVFIETRTFWPSVIAAAWACTLKTPFFWLHEHVWEHFSKKGAKPA